MCITDTPIKKTYENVNVDSEQKMKLSLKSKFVVKQLTTRRIIKHFLKSIADLVNS